MVMRALRFSPGIEPRMPISFGCSIVSHTFTVAHGAGGLAGLGGGGRDERGEGVR